jgi:sulfonate dioxygenase
MLCVTTGIAKLSKEAFVTGPKAFRSDAELKGTAKQPPAKYPNYLPTWPEKK